MESEKEKKRKKSNDPTLVISGILDCPSSIELSRPNSAILRAQLCTLYCTKHRGTFSKYEIYQTTNVKQS